MRGLLTSWQFWALGSAVFAALTAILAKIGIKDIPSDFATLVRTAVILIFGAALVAMTGQWRSPSTVPANTWLFLTLSGLATGASWLCYFRALKLGDAARVAPVDKLSVVLVAIIGAAVLGEKLSGRNWVGVAFIAVGAVLVALK
ncbi:MAG: transporter [Caulobacter sp.]|nr:transporter [Caulobacter sp.]